MWRLSFDSVILYKGQQKPEIVGYPDEFDPFYEVQADNNMYCININTISYFAIEQVEDLEDEDIV